MTAPPRFAGVELGGTKAIAVLAEQDTIIARAAFPTTTPGETLSALRGQLGIWRAAGAFAGLGIAAFGPIRLDPAASDFGTLLATPKAGWAGAAVSRTLTNGLDCPWSIDTDVNGAALAEYRWGGGVGCASLCYVTIGTGLGGGLLLGGVPVHGALHPEIGHLRLRRVVGEAFGGVCPFHGDCIEGLVSGPALRARFGMDPAEVADSHPLWPNIAADIAELCSAILLTTAANRILFGGSVATARTFLLPLIRARVTERLGGYLPFATPDDIADVIQLAHLGDQAGPLGAIALAQRAASGGPSA